MAEYRFSIIDGSTVTQIEDPMGWDTLELSVERDNNYIGMFSGFSTDLKFTGDAYTLIKNRFDTFGIDYLLKLKCEYLCNGSYSELFTAKLNLFKYTEEKSDSCTCSVNVEDESPAVKIRSRSKTKVDLQSTTSLGGTSLTPITGIINEMTLQSRNIRLATRCEIDPIYEGTSFVIPTTGGTERQNSYLGLVRYEELIDARNFVPALGELNTVNPAPTSLDPITYEGRLKGTITTTGAGGTSITVTPFLEDGASGLYLANFTGTPGSTILMGANEVVDFDLSGTGTWSNLATYYQFGLFLVNTATATGVTVTLDTSASYLLLYKDTTTPATTCNTSLIHEALASVYANITDISDVVRSTLFGRKNSAPTSYPSNGSECFTALTNGYQIRKFPLTERPLYFSGNDMWEGLNPIYNIGLGVENNGSSYVVRIEKKDYFFESTPFLTLDSIFTINYEIAYDMMYNQLEVGYNKYGATEKDIGTGTTDAYCTTRELSSTSQNVEADLNLKSTFIADHYALENSRRRLYIDEATQEYRYDEDLFIIATKRGVNGSNEPNELTDNEQDENYTTVTEVIDPSTCYNLRLSPMRNLLRWAYWIVTSLGLESAKKFLFRKGTKNYLMESEFTSDTTDASYSNEVLSESQDYINTDAFITNNTGLFKPIYANFEYPLSFGEWVSFNENNLVSGKPNYYHSILIGRDLLNLQKAYLWTVKYRPNERMATFKVILANE
jgi:hypothetical protein